MSIELSLHAKKRLKMRGINEKDVLMTLRNPDKILFDEETGNFIAVKKLNDKILIVAYTTVKGIAKIVSAFQTSKLNIIGKRIKKGRWRQI